MAIVALVLCALPAKAMRGPQSTGTSQRGDPYRSPAARRPDEGPPPAPVPVTAIAAALLLVVVLCMALSWAAGDGLR